MLPHAQGFTRITANRYTLAMVVARYMQDSLHPCIGGCRGSIAVLLIASAIAPSVTAVDTATFSEQLLQSYFDTAGVCTTSSVDSIVESAEHVTVNISIQAATAKALVNASDALRDDWFSLHCPPEIHGVWRQADPPGDVLVTGAINDTIHHTLSCRSYLDLDQRRQPVSVKQRIMRAVDLLLGR